LLNTINFLVCWKLYWFFHSIYDLQVRIFKFKPEPYATENTFMSLPGIIKCMIQL
jgi:hypothetical protein